MPDQIAAIRRFSRFYTRQVGALRPDLLGSALPLAEARLLYEIAQQPGCTASALGRELGLDAGHLSRLLARLEGRGLLRRAPDPEDARRTRLELTAAGKRDFAALDSASAAEVESWLAPLPGPARAALAASLERAEHLLTPPAPEVALRPHRPGDIGWIISRHGALYAEEYGWSGEFEALVAEIGAQFLRGHDKAREVCLIADLAGERLGSVAVVRLDEETAKLRLLLVEPAARGMGLGQRLVAAAEDFARGAGYRRMTLWTQSCLTAARRLYAGRFWRLTATEEVHSFGAALTSETWEKALL